MSDDRPMRAVVMTEFGPPKVLVVTEVPTPVAGPGELAIDVEVANITFVETQLRAGRPPFPGMLPTLPVIPGNGVGGVVAAVGPGVDADMIGHRVVSGLHGSGGYAERAVATATDVLEVADGVDTRDAVAVLADGRTAMLLLRRARVRTGETVLVEAAAGGVGSLLVQLARREGARVVALAGGEQKLAVARDLGADVTVDYRVVDWPAAVRAAVDAVDVVFDGVGGAIGAAAFDLVRDGGRLCAYGAASGEFSSVSSERARARGVTLTRASAERDELLELSRVALHAVADGWLRPVIGQTFALADAAAAHTAIAARRTVGKTLLIVK
ncbi:MAG TPA: zinc-binding dehydrogenase [Euzebyales bacterium]